MKNNLKARFRIAEESKSSNEMLSVLVAANDHHKKIIQLTRWLIGLTVALFVVTYFLLHLEIRKLLDERHLEKVRYTNEIYDLYKKNGLNLKLRCYEK